jgi:glucosyl-dolichyl phosphate glucuronosyltransferase
MVVSICICTHNRSDDVAECLASLAPQVDVERGEIIVIDSASDPRAAGELAEIAARHSARLVRLEEPGLSIARNAAVSAARGDWVAFLDDDAVPFPDYFAALLSAIERVPERVVFFGGRLKPRWPKGTAPAGERWSRMLSLIDDPTERETELGLIYGANIVYRRNILLKFNAPFDPSLGRTGRNLMSGEEMKLHFALKDMKFRAYYFGTMGAEHKIAPGRMTRSWVRQRAFWEGITLVALTNKMNLPASRGAKTIFQIVKAVALVPSLLFNDANSDNYIRFWTSVGVIRARLLGIPGSGISA